MSWTYDTHGRVTGKGQTVDLVTKAVGYTYTNGDLTSLVTPSGQTITYSYTDHRITSIKVNAATLLSGVTYFPFGPVSGWSWGNSSTVSRTYDTDGKVTHIATAGDGLTFGYDDAFRINSLSDSLFLSSSYTVGYAGLDQVNSLTQSTGTSAWTYDADGNRLTQTGSSNVTFTPSSSSNRLSSTSGALIRAYGYDAAGNTTSYTGASFRFNQRGRMSSATVGSTGASYVYNALGQLIEKTTSGVTTILMYDEAGHLLGEYSSAGAMIQETIWMGETPVATLRPNGSTVSIYYVHTDHLNAPRVVTQSTDNSPRWLWGGKAASQNPVGLGTFVYNLRYPGQYFQAETGLSNNYFRDYDPATGRYIESDPIGLRGGVNTYVYAGHNPINRFDRRGLYSDSMGDEARALAALGPAALNYLSDNPDVAWATFLGLLAEKPGTIGDVEALDGLLSGAVRGDETALGTFTAAQTTTGGGQLFTSVGSITQAEFTPIVENAVSMGDEVSILSGVHGAPDGSMEMSVAMFQSDVATFGGINGVTVYDMNALLENPSSLTAILNGGGTIIGAFCNSGLCLAPYR